MSSCIPNQSGKRYVLKYTVSGVDGFDGTRKAPKAVVNSLTKSDILVKLS
jgi:hypothetical protein